MRLDISIECSIQSDQVENHIKHFVKSKLLRHRSIKLIQFIDIVLLSYELVYGLNFWAQQSGILVAQPLKMKFCQIWNILCK